MHCSLTCTLSIFYLSSFFFNNFSVTPLIQGSGRISIPIACLFKTLQSRPTTYLNRVVGTIKYRLFRFCIKLLLNLEGPQEGFPLRSRYNVLDERTNIHLAPNFVLKSWIGLHIRQLRDRKKPIEDPKFRKVFFTEG